MSWKDKAVALVKRFGEPAKFAAKMILGAVIPGGGAVVELVEKVLDCADDTLKDNLDANEAKAPAATAEDLERVAEVLDVLGGDLGALTAKIASLEKLPLEASRTLEVAMATDAHCQAALRRLDDLARRFDRLEEQNRQLLKGQGYAAGILDDMLPLMKRTAGVADFVEEMRSAGLTLEEFRKVLREFQDAARRPAAGPHSGGGAEVPGGGQGAAALGGNGDGAGGGAGGGTEPARSGEEPGAGRPPEVGRRGAGRAASPGDLGDAAHPFSSSGRRRAARGSRRKSATCWTAGGWTCCWAPADGGRCSRRVVTDRCGR